MRSRNGVHVVKLAICGQFAMEIWTIPGRDALGAIVGILMRDIGLAINVVRLSNPITASAFGHRLAIVHHPLTGKWRKWTRAMGEHNAAKGDRCNADNSAQECGCELPPHTLPTPQPIAITGLTAASG